MTERPPAALAEAKSESAFSWLMGVINWGGFVAWVMIGVIETLVSVGIIIPPGIHMPHYVAAWSAWCVAYCAWMAISAK